MAKALIVITLSLLSWILWLIVSQYLLGPRYEFNTPSAFEGEKIYNPYQSIQPEKWLKSNFHAHAHSWNGMTNGHGTAQDIHNAYDSLNYGIHCVSNYHHIDTTHTSQINYLSAYEHGYNTNKTHQLVLGSNRVRWKDYIFPQTIHNKQHILNLLQEDSTLTVMNHPELRGGYTLEDLSLLENYDCMEVLNPSVTSTKHWDAALSAGKKIFVMGNDDIHDVINKERLGVRCTYVNASDSSGKSVIQALKNGNAYGVIVGEEQHYDSIPRLLEVSVRQDSIFIKMDQVAQAVTLTGQNGKAIAATRSADQISYKLLPSDHYARATFIYENGTTIYLNPLFFVPESSYHKTFAIFDPQSTWIYRIIGIVVLALWGLLLIITFTKKRLRFPKTNTFQWPKTPTALSK